MTPDEVLEYCLGALEGTILVKSWGERGIFYNPENKLKRGIYVLTVKEYDGENDASSQLDRTGVYRVNVGVPPKTFERMFGPRPKRPPKGGRVDMDYDFSAIDQIMPAPVYAWMSWICVLNPSESTFETLKPLIREAYDYAREKYRKKRL